MGSLILLNGGELAAPGSLVLNSWTTSFETKINWGRHKLGVTRTFTVPSFSTILGVSACRLGAVKTTPILFPLGRREPRAIMEDCNTQLLLEVA